MFSIALTKGVLVFCPYASIPYLFMYRGTQGGALLSLAIAGYLAFQHVTRVGSFGKAFEQGSIIATLGIICITVVPLVMLFWVMPSSEEFAPHCGGCEGRLNKNVCNADAASYQIC
jgi:hypothetical protein